MAQFMSLVHQSVSLKKFLQFPLKPYGTMLINGGVQTKNWTLLQVELLQRNRPC
jgi:hypothetical protein